MILTNAKKAEAGAAKPPHNENGGLKDEGFESLVKTYDNGATAEYIGSGFTAWKDGRNAAKSGRK